MDRRRSRHAGGWAMALYAAACLATAVQIPLRPATDRLADLRVYLGAIASAQQGGGLYEFHAANGDPFTYPPFAALLMTPLTWLPPTEVEIGWTVATFAAVVALAGVVLRANGRSSGLRQWPVWVVSTALLVSAPEQSNVRFGQVSLFLALAVFAGLSSARRSLGPVAVGLATSVKLTPGVFLLDLLVARRWRHAAYALAALLGSTAVAWLWRPAASRRFWGHTLFETDRIGDLAQPGNQSVYGVLARSATPPQAAKAAWVAIAVVVTVVGLYRAHRLRQAGHPGSALIVVGLIAVAVSPVSWVHHQIWTVLAAVTLLLAPTRVCRVAGGLVLLVMVVDTNLAAVAPTLPGVVTWPLTNLRALVVVALCLWGLPAGTSIPREDGGSIRTPPPCVRADGRSDHRWRGRNAWMHRNEEGTAHDPPADTTDRSGRARTSRPVRPIGAGEPRTALPPRPLRGAPAAPEPRRVLQLP